MVCVRRRSSLDAYRAVMATDENLRLEHQLCVALHNATRAITGCYRPLLDEIGLTHSQYGHLLRIRSGYRRTITSSTASASSMAATRLVTTRCGALANRVELCFTPTYSSWANPIGAHFGPLREFVLNNSNHPNHVVLTRRLHAHLRWRNANARHPDLLAAQRRERARVRAEKQQRWGRPRAA